MKQDKYIGLIVDDYIVVEKLHNYYSSCSGYRIVCQVCGHEKITTADRLRNSPFRHSLIKCEDTFVQTTLLNKTFGEMKVIDFGVCPDDGKNRTILKVQCQICGCERWVDCSEFHTKQSGWNHNGSCVRYLKLKAKNPRLYDTWRNMKDRCENPNNESYISYGQRGIKCLYNDFVSFYNDMYESYIEHCEKHGESNTTIERIDVNGSYEKSNIKWATWEEQVSNRRNSKLFKATSPDGEIFYSKSIKQFAREHNMPFASIRQVLIGKRPYFGWIFEYVDIE